VRICFACSQHTSVPDVFLTHVEFKRAQNTVNGSEHWIGAVQCPFEIQSVHSSTSTRNTNYTSYEQARAMYNGIAVVPVLAVNTTKNTALDPVVNAPDGIVSGESSDVKLDLLGLSPAGASRYYSYLGSMATPECHEVVQWFVLKNVQSINNAQLAFLLQAQRRTTPGLLSFHAWHRAACRRWTLGLWKWSFC